MDNKILVIGSTGTTGNELTKCLIDKNADFVAAVRNSTQEKVFHDKNINTILLTSSPA